MPDIQALRGWRYNLGQVGDLSDVVAPPYDVIDPDFQSALYQRHPCNVIRLILNREEPGDTPANNRYTRAARFLRQWRAEEVLVEEGEPAIYVYHQTFVAGGTAYTRKGFMARVRLEAFGEGSVYAHEETMPGPKADRLALMEATRANLSPIFALYPDPDGAVDAALQNAVATQPPLEAADHLGVVHRMWPISDAAIVGPVTSLVGTKSLFIADGHHRYETAVAYRNRMRQAGKLGTDDAPANFVLMMLVAMSDPGLVILPTHRLVSGIEPLTAEELRGALGEAFHCETIGQATDGCRATWDWMQADGSQGILGLGTAADRTWQIARLVHPEAMEALAADHCSAWRSLGVSILHELVLEKLLAGRSRGGRRRVRYVHELSEVASAMGAAGEGEDAQQLACLVQPAGIEHLEAVATRLEKMPAKSTYFYPKLLSGLVINPLR